MKMAVATMSRMPSMQLSWMFRFGSSKTLTRGQKVKPDVITCAEKAVPTSGFFWLGNCDWDLLPTQPENAYGVTAFLVLRM